MHPVFFSWVAEWQAFISLFATWRSGGLYYSILGFALRQFFFAFCSRGVVSTSWTEAVKKEWKKAFNIVWKIILHPIEYGGFATRTTRSEAAKFQRAYVVMKDHIMTWRELLKAYSLSGSHCGHIFYSCASR